MFNEWTKIMASRLTSLTLAEKNKYEMSGEKLQWSAKNFNINSLFSAPTSTLTNGNSASKDKPKQMTGT